MWTVEEQLVAAHETISRLNRRCQAAEAEASELRRSYRAKLNVVEFWEKIAVLRYNELVTLIRRGHEVTAVQAKERHRSWMRRLLD